jgi:hypothetical protein
MFNDSKEAFVNSGNYSGLLLAVLIGNQVNELLDFNLFDLLTQKLRQKFNVADCFLVNQHVLVLKHMNTDVEQHRVVFAFDDDPSLCQLVELGVELLHDFLLCIDLSHVGDLLEVLR